MQGGGDRTPARIARQQVRSFIYGGEHVVQIVRQAAESQRRVLFDRHRSAGR
jgi:hypothetical protein